MGKSADVPVSVGLGGKNDAAQPRDGRSAGQVWASNEQLQFLVESVAAISDPPSKMPMAQHS